jgi:hypothetical protein
MNRFKRTVAGDFLPLFFCIKRPHMYHRVQLKGKKFHFRVFAKIYFILFIFATASGTKQIGQGDKKISEKTVQRGHKSWDKDAGAGQLGKNSWDMAAGTRKPGQDKTIWKGQPAFDRGQDRADGTART